MICLANYKKTKKLIGDGYDFSIHSANNEWLMSNMTHLGVKFQNNDTDVSNMFFGSKYHITVGGCNIYDAIYDESTKQNIFPVNNVPFGLLKWHDISIYFRISNNSVQQIGMNDVIICDYDTYNETATMNDFKEILWAPIEGTDNYLRFHNGMCGLQYIKYANANNVDAHTFYIDYMQSFQVGQYKAIKIKIPFAYIEQNYDSFIESYSSHQHGLISLITYNPDVLYETVYKRFGIVNEFDLFLQNCTDGMTNFCIISDKLLDEYPVITLTGSNTNIIIKCDRLEVLTDENNNNNNNTLYTYSCKEYDYKKIINMMYIIHVENRVLDINISNNDYILRFDRVYLNTHLRKFVAQNMQVPDYKIDTFAIASINTNVKL